MGVTQGVDQRTTERLGGLSSNLFDPHIPCFSFNGHGKYSLTFDRVDRVYFPVSRSFPGVHMFRSISYEHPVPNVRTGLFAIAARQAFAMGLGEHWDQLSSFKIDPLVDGFVARCA